MTERPDPGRVAAAAKAARDTLIEMVAEADDSLMERFFEAGTLTQEELAAGLARAIRAGALFPVFCTSALRNIGIQPLADALTTSCRRRRTARSEAQTRNVVRRRATAKDAPARSSFGSGRPCRSVRGPHHAVSRRVRRPQSRRDDSQHHAGWSGAHGPPAASPGQDPVARAGAVGRRPRRRGEAARHPHGRHARRQGRGLHRCRPSRSRSRSSPTRSSRRPAATRTRSARRCSACAKRIRRLATAATRKRTSCCSAARASCTSKSRWRS